MKEYLLSARRGGPIFIREVVDVATGKHPGGRPPKYSSVEDLQAAIDAYFVDCEGKALKDDDGRPVLYKGRPVIVGEKPPTVTGLALALGFSDRRSLLNYQGKKEFLHTITRAKARCEAYAESRLFDRNGTNGAQFSLRCNFGWSDASERDQKEQDLRIAVLKEKAGEGERNLEQFERIAEAAGGRFETKD